METQTVTSDALRFLLNNGCELLRAVRARGENPFEGCSEHLLVSKHNGRYYIVGDSLRDVSLLNSLGRLGVVPQPQDPEHTSCSIGRGLTGKWYGWSHRALVGFDVGDMLFDARCLDPNSGQYMIGADDIPFNKLGRELITTEAQARQAAENFSKYIS